MADTPPSEPVGPERRRSGPTLSDLDPVGALMANRFQSLFDAQREHFLTDATKSYEWRVDQLDRMQRMLVDNKEAFCAALHQDFGKPPFEQLFEITVPSGVIQYYRENLRQLMVPQDVRVPQGLERPAIAA